MPDEYTRKRSCQPTRRINPYTVTVPQLYSFGRVEGNGGIYKAPSLLSLPLPWLFCSFCRGVLSDLWSEYWLPSFPGRHWKDKIIFGPFVPSRCAYLTKMLSFLASLLSLAAVPVALAGPLVPRGQ